MKLLSVRFKAFLFCSFLCLCLTIAILKPVKIESDLLSLTTSENDSSLPLKELMQHYNGFIQVFIESSNFEDAARTAEEFYLSIDKTQFKDVYFKTEDLDFQESISFLKEYRNSLLSEKDISLLKEKNFEQIKKNTLRQLSLSAIPRFVKFYEDPFFLFSNYLNQFIQQQSSWTLSNGFLTQEYNNKHYILLLIQLENSTFQNIPIILDLQKKAVEHSNKKSHVYLAGSPIHTAVMTEKSQMQINILSILSISFSLCFIFILFGRFSYSVPILTSILFAFLVGYTSVILAFSNIHILTFVFGTSLIGLSVDYSFHYLSEKKIDPLTLKNMKHSFLTTIFCFFPLMFAGPEILKQLSLFTICGITSVYLFVTLLYPFFKLKEKKTYLKTFNPPTIKRKKTILSLLSAFIVLSLFQLQFKTNLSSFYQPDEKLAQVEMLNGKLNDISEKKVAVICDQDIQKALEKEEKFNIKGISQFIPSLKKQGENQNLIQELYKQQSSHLKDALKLPQKPIFVQTPFLEIANIQDNNLKKMINSFVLQTKEQTCLMTQTKEASENLTYFAPQEYLSEILTNYAQKSYKLIILSFCFLFLLLTIFYKKRAFLYLLPSIFAVGIVLSFLSITGTPVHFFHLLSIFIIIGVGLDYTIFHINSKKDQDLKVVLFSFLTSFIGFGLLSFTDFALIQSFGIVLAFGLSSSYLISLFFFRRGKNE